jgi:hypothetical protein
MKRLIQQFIDFVVRARMRESGGSGDMLGMGLHPHPHPHPHRHPMRHLSTAMSQQSTDKFRLSSDFVCHSDALWAAELAVSSPSTEALSSTPPPPEASPSAREERRMIARACVRACVRVRALMCARVRARVRACVRVRPSPPPKRGGSGWRCRWGTCVLAAWPASPWRGSPWDLHLRRVHLLPRRPHTPLRTPARIHVLVGVALALSPSAAAMPSEMMSATRYVVVAVLLLLV